MHGLAPPIPLTAAQARDYVGTPEVVNTPSSELSKLKALVERWERLRSEIPLKPTWKVRPMDAKPSATDEGIVAAIQQQPSPGTQMRNLMKEFRPVRHGPIGLDRLPSELVSDPRACEPERRAHSQEQWSKLQAQRLDDVNQWLSGVAAPALKRYREQADSAVSFSRAIEERARQANHELVWTMYAMFAQDLTSFESEYLEALSDVYRTAASSANLPSFDVICARHEKALARMSVDLSAKSFVDQQLAQSEGPGAAPLPANAEVEYALKVLWETVIAKPAQSGSRSGFDDRLNLQCVSLPRRPARARESKAELPFQWRIELPSTGALDEREQQFIQSADALVGAGLMERWIVRKASDGVVAESLRYGLTGAGWAVSTTHRRPFCLAYGAPAFRGLSSFRRIPMDPKSKREHYAVTGKTGFSSIGALEPWARSKAVLAAFPEIQAQLDGKEFQVTLERTAQKLWAVRGARPTSLVERPAPGSLPPEEEIKTLIRRRHGDGPEAPWSSGNICLPGGEEVDESIRTSDRHYAVAIIDGKIRKPNDRVSNALPHLEALVAAGVLTKSVRAGIPSGAKSSSSDASGHIYEMAPQYRSAVRSDRNNCFHLGKADVKFVAFKQDLDARGQPRVKYRIRLRYPEPPKWMGNSRVLEHWTELRNLLTQGEACDGNFTYSAADRDLRGGAGSCWPAFSQE
ncbi:MAG: hypothetical protein M3O62_06635 [Pseudomonadota bacterium]|nr:hypothetical protein [Pseudomonadota bacterium]